MFLNKAIRDSRFRPPPTSSEVRKSGKCDNIENHWGIGGKKTGSRGDVEKCTKSCIKLGCVDARMGGACLVVGGSTKKSKKETFISRELRRGWLKKGTAMKKRSR